MFLYRNILLQAWQLTWRHKYLWFFGLFAALLGNGGVLEIFFRVFSGDVSQGWLPGFGFLQEINFFSLSTLANMGRLLVSDPLSLLFTLTVFLLVIFVGGFLIWLIMVSQAALVHNAGRNINGKSHDFKDGLDVGMKKFWPVLGLNILVKIVISLVFLIISIPALLSIARADLFSANLFYVLAFLLFVPLAIIISFIIKYAIACVVIKGNKISEALIAGWQLFIKNWLVSLEMAFILFFINFMVGLGIIILFLLLSIPFLFLGLLFIKVAWYVNLWLIIVLAVILYLIIIIIIGSGLATFQVSSWTGLFIKLVKQGGVSKLARVFSRK